MDDMSMDMRLSGYELPGYEMAIIISSPTSASSFYDILQMESLLAG